MPVRRLYSRLMFDWETRMTTRDTNRLVRPFEWGMEWVKGWPEFHGGLPAADADSDTQERFLNQLNASVIADSDRFFQHRTPNDFHLSSRVFPAEKERTQVLQFTSPVQTPYPVNNLVTARWYPARRHNKKAVVLLPHWNSKPHSYIALCKILARLGISTLRMSLPYHDQRLPAETQRSDFAVSSNIARTIDATRQAVLDARCCYDWLQQQGYEHFGIVGTSLGSCYAFLTTAHDSRITVNAFNHASTHFADVVWTGQSTRHVRAGIEPVLDLERLRKAWASISPINYFDKFRNEEKPKKILVIYASYDLTFLPEFSRQVVEKFRSHRIDHQVRVLPCGHYSTGETPFKFIDGWHIGKFIKTAL